MGNDQDPEVDPAQPSTLGNPQTLTVKVRVTNAPHLTIAQIEDAVTIALNEITPAGAIVTARGERTDS